MLTSEIMLTNMNDFVAQKAVDSFPIVMAGLIASWQISIGPTFYFILFALIIPALFPEICWLTAFLTPFFAGLTVTLGPLIVGLTVIMTPLLILFSPLIIVFLMLFGVAVSVGGGTVSAGVIPWILGYFFFYGFFLFNAIFGEFILIPWFLLTIIP